MGIASRMQDSAPRNFSRSFPECVVFGIYSKGLQHALIQSIYHRHLQLQLERMICPDLHLARYPVLSFPVRPIGLIEGLFVSI